MKSTRDASRAHEDHLAEVLGGYRTPNSGATSHTKGDVRTPSEYVEAKTTGAASYSIKVADLKLAEREALLCGRRMLFALEFTGGPRPLRYFLMTEEDYLQMTVGD